MEFRKGDIVEYAGLLGKVILRNKDGEYPVVGSFDGLDYHCYFTEDGKWDPLHKEPLLKFISREEEEKIELYEDFIRRVLNMRLNKRDTDYVLDMLGFKGDK